MENSLFYILLTAAFINDGNAQGHPATEGQFKYAASIWHTGKHYCHGAIITISHVLTAGHCVHRKKIIDFRILAGIVTVTSSTIWYQVRSIHLHNEYDPVYDSNGLNVRSNNDIAVMELHNPPVFSHSIEPIPLSIESRSSHYYCCKFVWFRNRYSPTIKKVYLSSWWDDVVITTYEHCLELYPDIYPHYRCIFNPLDIRSPAPGDSGAPIVCDDKLIAIVTGGMPRANYAAKVIMVAPYIDWIQEKICL